MRKIKYLLCLLDVWSYHFHLLKSYSGIVYIGNHLGNCINVNLSKSIQMAFQVHRVLPT
jgi:hypothetical protein